MLRILLSVLVTCAFDDKYFNCTCFTHSKKSFLNILKKLWMLSEYTLLKSFWLLNNRLLLLRCRKAVGFIWSTKFIALLLLLLLSLLLLLKLVNKMGSRLRWSKWKYRSQYSTLASKDNNWFIELTLSHKVRAHYIIRFTLNACQALHKSLIFMWYCLF